MAIRSIQLLLILFVFQLQSCSSVNYLEDSLAQHGIMDDDEFIELNYSEKLNELGHLSEPWETNLYSGKGSVWVNKRSFLKQDSLTNSRGRVYTSKTEFTNNTLLYIDHGDEELMPITKGLLHEKLIGTARYTPFKVLHHFIENIEHTDRIPNEIHAIYSLNIGSYPVHIFINKSNMLVEKITYLSHHELYGDVTTSYIYTSYIKKEIITFPTHIKVEKINGKVNDEVRILDSKITSESIKLLEAPNDYHLAEPAPETVPEIVLTRYNDYIHFLDLKHTDDKVMVVEFEDYLLVAEAPMNSRNGELIIAEARKIAPSKPIKYFVFGHHHPHYLGGLRAFVHKEATILSTDISKSYVEYIAEANHTLQPDSLQLEPKQLKTQIIRDSLVLGENERMKIYFMGEKSSHTKDYLIYYFPKDKLLFQDDLCWIPKEGPITKARAREVGLYNSIGLLI